MTSPTTPPKPEGVETWRIVQAPVLIGDGYNYGGEWGVCIGGLVLIVGCGEGSRNLATLIVEQNNAAQHYTETAALCDEWKAAYERCQESFLETVGSLAETAAERDALAVKLTEASSEKYDLKLERDRLLSANKALREALEIIEAQDSGIVGSTAKADCMAAIARAALKQDTPG